MRRLLRTLLCAVLLVLATTSAELQTARIDGARLLKDLETLAADDMEGRLPGTPGSAKAREFIVQMRRSRNHVRSNSPLKVTGWLGAWMRRARPEGPPVSRQKVCPRPQAAFVSDP